MRLVPVEPGTILARIRKRHRRRWTRWVALGVAILLGLLYYRPVRAYVDTRHTLQARTAEVQALAERKRQLQERLAEIESGATLARGARRLGLVKPGERLFIVRGIPEWRRAHAKGR
jgi:cell division protein FtsB